MILQYLLDSAYDLSESYTSFSVFPSVNKDISIWADDSERFNVNDAPEVEPCSRSQDLNNKHSNRILVEQERVPANYPSKSATMKPSTCKLQSSTWREGLLIKLSQHHRFATGWNRFLGTSNRTHSHD